MKKILLLGALLILGTVSFGKTEIIQEDTPGGTYSGNSSLQLITEGNAVSPVDGVWLEIAPMSSAGTQNNSIEFQFGELKAGQVLTAEGSFYAEVKQYTTTPDEGGAGTSTTTFERLKFTSVADNDTNMTEGQIYVGLRNGTDTGATVTSDVYTAGSNTKDATIEYNLVDNKGGLVGSKDRYEGYITSTITVENNAKAGNFQDNGVALVVKVNKITAN